LSAEKHTAHFIVGPTAVGKTSYAIEKAQSLNTQILSADSRQMYKHLNIGTAKPTPLERELVEHHFVDFLDLDVLYSAGQFERDALNFMEKYFRNNPDLVVAGGSGLYVNALLNGLDDLPRSEKIRSELNLKLEIEGKSALQRLLKAKDPEHFEDMDIENSQRLVRALEVCMITGSKYSELRTSKKVKRPFKINLLGLTRERSELYDRVNQRVDLMMEAGFLDEAKALHSKSNLNSLKTVGYTELFSYLNGDITLSDAVELIKRNTRRYAKRQLTWFKRLEGIEWVDLSGK